MSYVSVRTSSATVAVTGVGFEASSLMVPMAVPFDSEIVALSGLLRVTVKVSSSSSIVSGVVWTVKVLVVSLARMVRVVAGTAVKSAASAVSVDSMLVAYWTVTSLALAWLRVTVKVTALPSAALASATLSLGSPWLTFTV